VSIGMVQQPGQRPAAPVSDGQRVKGRLLLNPVIDG
jgi:hypothetical protein